MAIEEIRMTLVQLLQALESGDEVRVLAAQATFSAAVEKAWAKYQAGEIQVESGAITPQKMHLFATQDLPVRVKNPAAYKSIHAELEQFLMIMDNLVRPSEE